MSRHGFTTDDCVTDDCVTDGVSPIERVLPEPGTPPMMMMAKAAVAATAAPSAEMSTSGGRIEPTAVVQVEFSLITSR